MDFVHEIVKFGDVKPYKFFVCKLGNINPHWHLAIELTVVLSGKVNVSIEDKKYVFNKGEVYLVNSNSIHSMNGDNAVLAVLQIDLNSLKYYRSNLEQIRFMEKLDFNNDDIKSIFASFLDSFNYGKNDYLVVYHMSLIYKMMFNLLKNYQIGFEEKKNQDNVDRLTSIIAFINNNYAEPINLADIAKKEFISEAYLSRFFKKNMNINFSDYLKSVRLSKAVELLFTTNDSISDISSSVGFPNAKAFVSAFKEKYNLLPSEYRKNNEKNIIENNDIQNNDKEKAFNYLDDTFEDDRQTIISFTNKYKDLNVDSSNLSSNEKVDSKSQIIEIDTNKNIGVINKTFLNVIGISRLKDVLDSTVQKQLEITQKEIGFKYLKTHSVFDDDLLVVTRRNGQIYYNFSLIDKAYDFLLSNNIKPIVQLSFMPQELAKKNSKKIFLGKTIISEPKDINKWDKLVQTFLKHLINKYGINEIKTWLFSVWSEPSTSNFLFGLEDPVFFELYEHTYKDVKNIDKELKFIGPASFSAYGKSEGWLKKFLVFAKKKNIIPDFISVHYYDVDLSWIDDPNEKEKYIPNRMYLSPIDNSFDKFIMNIEDLLKELEINRTLLITEWNNTASHFDYLSDTCFKSSYIAKNVLNNMDKVGSFGYWLLSDYHMENVLSNDEFQGGLGLFTINGIKKPSYYAFQLLSKMKGVKVDSGINYFVCKDGDKLVIYLYNYNHYSYDYSRQKNYSVTKRNRYTPFDKFEELYLHLNIKNLSGEYEIKETIINRHNGSAFDKYLELGEIQDYEIDPSYLNGISKPKILYKRIHLQDGLLLDYDLEPFEVRMIEISKVF